MAAGGMAVRVADRVAVPGTVRDLASFRQWMRSGTVAEPWRFSFFNRTLWIDPVERQPAAHRRLAKVFHTALAELAHATGLGVYRPGGVLLSNPKAGFATVPDGLFYTTQTSESGRLREVPGPGEPAELEGVPDLVVEVVTDTSLGRDLVDLSRLYEAAGVREFWTISFRYDPALFQPWIRHNGGYHLFRKIAGRWWKSHVFDRYVRLTKQGGAKPGYVLEVK
jgi:Uma2 family endonuclease